ncbi:MAG: hypothetical protein GKS06_07680 [Acidobacteria bacterium]|nr:hypothetical protein [Acidobacteriota bacterium]
MRFRHVGLTAAFGAAFALHGCSAPEQAEVAEQSTVYVPVSARQVPALEEPAQRYVLPVEESIVGYLPGGGIGNPGRFKIAALPGDRVAAIDLLDGTLSILERSAGLPATRPRTEPLPGLTGIALTVGAGGEHVMLGTGGPPGLVAIGFDNSIAASAPLPGTPWKLEAVGDGTFVAVLMETGFVGRFAASGDELAHYTVFGIPDGDIGGEVHLWPQQDFVVSGEMLYVTTAETYEITAFSIDGQAQWVVRHDAERLPIPEHLSGQTMGRDRRAGRAAGATIDAEYADVRFPEFYPSLARINTDAASRLYVFPYVVESDAGRYPVDVYDVDGNVLVAGWLPFQGWDAQAGNSVYRVEARDGNRAIVRYELTLPNAGTAAAQ